MVLLFLLMYCWPILLIGGGLFLAFLIHVIISEGKPTDAAYNKYRDSAMFFTNDSDDSDLNFGFYNPEENYRKRPSYYHYESSWDLDRDVLEDLYDDAIDGDPEAIEIMEDEYGDEWRD